MFGLDRVVAIAQSMCQQQRRLVVDEHWSFPFPFFSSGISFFAVLTGLALLCRLRDALSSGYSQGIKDNCRRTTSQRGAAFCP